jgi:glycine/D-amino acid oxidase-like deaminating enzyme
MVGASTHATNFWLATAPPAPCLPVLEGTHRAEFCVIGAGYTGLSAALRLAAAGRTVIVLEAEQPGAGASGCNTGWWLPLWSFTSPAQLLPRLGDERTQALASLMVDAGKIVPALVHRYDMDCDLRTDGVLMLARSERTLAKLHTLAEDWDRYGNTLTACANDSAQTDHYIGGLLVPQAGQINPLAFCRGLANAAIGEGAGLFARSPATALMQTPSGVAVDTPNGRVIAEKVLLATDAYSTAFAGFAQSFLNVRIGMIASAPLPDRGARYLRGGAPFTDMDSGDAFAVGFTQDGRLLTSVLPNWRQPISPQPFWRKFRAVFPQAPEQLDWQYTWSGNVAIPKDRFVKLYRLSENVLACLGYSGNGIAQATMAGQDIAESLLTNDPDRCRLPRSEPAQWSAARMLSAVINRLVLPMVGSVVYR